MPELLRTLIVISVLSAATFWVIAKALPDFLTVKEFKRWITAWFTIVITAFISHNIWLFLAITACFCFFRIAAEPKLRIIYYLVLFCAVPQYPVEIPGLLGIRYLFNIDYPRLLIIALLLGPFFKNHSNPRLFALSSDRYIVLFVCLMSYLSFRDNTFTNALRESILFFLSIIVPYYTLSRYLSDISQLNRAFIAMFIGLSPFAVVGVFETLRHWHLYNALAQNLVGSEVGGGYDVRSGGLRASAIFQGPIVLGYVMVIGFGLLLYLKPLIKNQRMLNMMGLTIAACLLASMARGPWVGFVTLYLAYIWTGREAVKKTAQWALAGLVLLPVLSLTSVGDKFIQLLPFIGSTRSDTVDYRSRLFENAWIVFQRHPWFGSTTFLDTPEMESMRQGEGIIDLVNTFIQIALPYGVFGLFLFLTIFLGLLFRCYFILKRIPRDEVNLIRMGRALFAILSAILTIITTTSSINYVPTFYWALVGIIAAYLNVAEKTIRLNSANR
jgi:O-Antigen ligase